MIKVELIEPRKETTEMWSLKSVEEFVKSHSCVVDPDDGVMQATVDGVVYRIHIVDSDVAARWKARYSELAEIALEEGDPETYYYNKSEAEKLEAYC